MTRSRLVLPTYLLAEGFSLFGNSAINLVLPWLVLARTGDAAAAAIVAACVGIVQIAGTLVVGPLIDRFGARPIAVLADIGSAASVAALALTDAGGPVGLAVITVLAAAGAFFDIPGMTARQTMMPRVAERAGIVLDSVASTRQVVFGLCLLAGPTVAGLLLGVLEPGQVLWITAGCSALAALTTLGIRVPPVVPEGVATDSGVLAGWRVIRQVPILRKLFVVAMVSAAMSAPLMQVLLPAHFTGLGRPDQLGFTLSALAVGVIGGAGLYAVLARFSRRMAWTFALVATTAGLVLIATLSGFWLVAVGAVVVGVASGIVNPVFGVVVAERVPAEKLGRAMGLINAASLASGPLGLGVAALAVADGNLTLLAWGIVAAWLAAGLFGGTGRALGDLATPAGTPAPQKPEDQPADAHD